MKELSSKNPTLIPVIISLFIIFLGVRGFNLIPVSIVYLLPGYFRIEDGVFFAMIFTFIYAIHKKKIQELRSYNFSIFIIIISGLILLNPLLAQLHFGQPYNSGILGYRHWLYYLIFFVFVIFLDSDDRVKKFITFFSLMGILIAVLALVQYKFNNMTIFSSYNNLGQADLDIRLGSSRLNYPIADLGVLIFFMLFSSTFISKARKHLIINILMMTLILLIIYLTQTRMRILGIMFVSFLGIFTMKNKKILIPSFILVTILLLYLNLLYTLLNGQYFLDHLEEFRSFRLLELSYSELSSVEGNAGLRINQSLHYWEFFKKYPLFGAGTLISQTPLTVKYNFWPSTDVGMFRFLAEFGIAGMLWLTALSIVWFKKIKELKFVLKDNEQMQYYYGLVCGLNLYFYYILITFFSFGHFISPSRIIGVTMILALVAIIDKIVKEKLKFERIPHHQYLSEREYVI